MNRWARSHAEVLQADLAADEELLTACRVAISRTTPPRSGFPAPGRVFALGLSDRRLLLYRCTRWLGRPEALATSVPLDQVDAIAPARSLGGTRVRVMLGSGPQAVLEPVWGGSLTALVATYSAIARR